MKRPALALALCLFLVPICVAQQATGDDAPASKEDIQRYLDTMHINELMKNLMAQMGAQMHQLVHDQIAKQTNLQPDAEAILQKSMDDTFKDFPVDDYLAAVVPVYRKYLTKGDVNALVAFYSSPVGQKLLAETPAMTADAMKASSGIFQKMMADEMQRIQQQMSQMTNDNGASGQPKSQPLHN
jgi:uncharacterized protein